MDAIKNIVTQSTLSLCSEGGCTTCSECSDQSHCDKLDTCQWSVGEDRCKSTDNILWLHILLILTSIAHQFRPIHTLLSFQLWRLQLLALLIPQVWKGSLAIFYILDTDEWLELSLLRNELLLKFAKYDKWDMSLIMLDVFQKCLFTIH